MKSSEFRLGNIIEAKFVTEGFKWTFVKIKDLEWIEEYPETYRCIPLSEEWFGYFGFIAEDKRPSKDHGQYFSKPIYDYKYSFAYAPFRKDWGFYHSYTDAPNEEDNNKYDLISCDIKYVHQLQNLYFALTGEDLEIKY
jgi:hypothetical protein